MFRSFLAYIQVEFNILLRNKGEWLHVLLFYAITLALFGFSMTQTAALPAAVGGAVLWVALLFSMLSLSHSVLRKDLEEGWLEQLKLTPYPLWLFLLAKMIAHWLTVGLGLLILLPLGLIWLNFPLSLLWGFGIIYLLATPALMMMVLFGASLTLGLPQPGMLIGVMLLPLYVPVLILGQSALQVLHQGGPWPAFESALLAALSIVSIVCLPYFSALSLQQTSEDE